MDTTPSRDVVARKAYFIYLDKGCPQGQDLQHWFEAEALTKAERNASRQSIPPRM